MDGVPELSGVRQRLRAQRQTSHQPRMRTHHLQDMSGKSSEAPVPIRSGETSSYPLDIAYWFSSPIV